MSSWGNYDNSANAPLWAVNSTITHAAPGAAHSAPTRANVTQLFGNTTPSAYITDETIGLYAIDTQEEVVSESGAHKVAHSGWVLRTEGSGGRAGRVQHEVLVALANVNGDSDGQTYANVVISLSAPGTKSVTHGSANANSVTFSVTPTLTGNTAANLTYKWQVNNNQTGGTWVDMANGNNPQPGGIQKSGVTTASFTATPWNTTANNYVFRVIVTAADEGVSATSANAQIVIL